MQDDSGIFTPYGDKVLSDEEALTFMFAAYASTAGDEGIFRIPQPHRHRLIDKVLHQIVAQFETELKIPWIRGNFRGLGAAVIHLDKADFSEYANLCGPGSLGVLAVRVEKSPEDGRMIYTGFDAHVRLGETNTWLCAGIKTPTAEGESLLDFENAAEGSKRHDESEDDDETYTNDEYLLDPPSFYDKNTTIIADIAAQVAVADGFGAVALRPELRKQFAIKFVEPRVDEFIERDPFISEEQIADAVAHRARDYWGFYVIPMRARSLNDGGKSPAQIAKILGITKDRAEKAIDLSRSFTNYSSDTYIMPLIQKYDPTIKAPAAEDSA